VDREVRVGFLNKDKEGFEEMGKDGEKKIHKRKTDAYANPKRSRR
jgi:hypothetical protein